MIERLAERSWEETKWEFLEEIEEYTSTNSVIKQDWEYRYLLILFDGNLEIYRRKLK